MLILREKSILSSYLFSLQSQGKKIGFVPTMGALHEGHLSLIKMASEISDIVICSIFVNPTQFNDHEDFEKYPVRNEEDINKLLESDVDILFLPSIKEIYGDKLGDLEVYDLGNIEKILEGAFRPGHFQGVGQVMSRLLRIINPNFLLMGQKDYQQTLIINILLNILSIKSELIICPIIREKDGLAMSSRNIRLGTNARKKASIIYKTLSAIRDDFGRMGIPELLEKGKASLEKEGTKVEYLVIADRRNLAALQAPIKGPMLCLVAAWLDGVRLIDNVFL